MGEINFKINRKIEIIFHDRGIGISLIQEIDEDGIYITIPLIKHQRQLLTIGERVEVVYCYDNELFGFTAKVIDKKVENIPLYKIEIPEKFDRVQRRNFVRVPTNFEIQYGKSDLLSEKDCARIKLEQLEREYKDQLGNGFSMDLSGGGIKLSIKEPLKENETVLVLLKHPSLDIVVKGKVVRCSPFISEKYVLYHVGIKFKEMSDALREKIIRFVFMRMREIRKNA